MGRILFWLLIGVVAYLAYRWWKQSLQSADAQAKQTAQRAGRDSAENIVRCAVCGLNLPQSEALPAVHHKQETKKETARWYCSEDHRQQEER